MSEKQLALSLEHLTVPHPHFTTQPVKPASATTGAWDSVIAEKKRGGAGLEQTEYGIWFKARKAKEEWHGGAPLRPRRQCQTPPAGWGRQHSQML